MPIFPCKMRTRGAALYSPNEIKFSWLVVRLVPNQGIDNEIGVLTTRLLFVSISATVIPQE